MTCLVWLLLCRILLPGASRAYQSSRILSAARWWELHALRRGTTPTTHSPAGRRELARTRCRCARGVDEDNGEDISATSSTTPPVSSRTLTIVPSTVILDDVSLQLPRTWQRQLFASDPHRPHALRHVSLSIPSSTRSLVLLTGPSSSGKSVLLNVIRGRWIPTSGCVKLSTEQPLGDGVVATPVCLDDPRRDTHRDESYRSVRDVVDRHVARLVEGRVDADESVARRLVSELSQRLNVPEDSSNSSFWSCKPCELSQSDSYRLGLLLASLESVLVKRSGSLSAPDDDDESDVALPAPILLLDEWLDKEGSSVIQSVQGSLEALANLGSVVCCVTHKPERFLRKSSSSETTTGTGIRHVILRSGRVVEDTDWGIPQ